ncbi:excisionase family DNA-binding protein [Chitinimonas naiadis]
MGSPVDLIFVPFLTRARFAELVGITEDTLERWIRDGRIRTHRIGKRSLVDMRQWLADERGA